MGRQTATASLTKWILMGLATTGAVSLVVTAAVMLALNRTSLAIVCVGMAVAFIWMTDWRMRRDNTRSL